MPATDVAARIGRPEDAPRRRRPDDPPMERLHLIRRTTALALAISGLSVATAAAAPVLKLAPASGPPGSVTKLTGTGFSPNETLQLQFDATSAGVAVADDTGAFTAVPLGT